MSDSLSETDPDLDLLYSYGCAITVDLDHGVPRRVALDRYVGFVVAAFDADRVRIRALIAASRGNVQEQGDHAWREAALLAERALARLGTGDTSTSG